MSSAVHVESSAQNVTSSNTPNTLRALVMAGFHVIQEFHQVLRQFSSFRSLCHGLNLAAVWRGVEYGFGRRHRTASLGPPLPVHPRKELARPGRLEQQNLQRFVTAIILDRNSQVRFHKSMKKGLLTKINRACVRARTEG